MAKKHKEAKLRAYRLIVITIAFLLVAASIFTWLPFVQGVPKVLIIVLASVLVLSYIGIIIWTEISYKKRSIKE